jgi:hypothetical protein
MASNAAIIIGIDQYATPEHCLDGSCNDAIEFANWALSPDGGDVAPHQLLLLLSPLATSQIRGGIASIPQANVLPYRGASRRDILTAVQEVAGLSASVDRLYFYFAGHGSSAPGMVTSLRAEPVLIPSDFKDPQLDNNLLLGFHEILEPLMDKGPQTQFLFFDACRDFALESYARVAGPSVGRYIGLTPEAAATRRAQLMLYATAPGQKAAVVGKGIFGSILLECLYGRGGALDWNGTSYDLRFSRLATRVREAVVDRVSRTFPDRATTFIQAPEMDHASADINFLIRTIPRESVSKLDLTVIVSPSAARPDGKIKVTYTTPAGELDIAESPPPPLKTDSHFALWPGSYAIEVGNPSFAKHRRPVQMDAPRTERVELLQAGQSQSVPINSLTVVSPDRSLVVVVTPPPSEDGRVEVLRGVGSCYVPHPKPGIYRAQIELPDGTGAVQLIDFPQESGEVRLIAPPARMGKEQMNALDRLKIPKLIDGQLEPSEMLGGPISDARLVSLLGFAAYAAYAAPDNSMERLRSLGVTRINPLPQEAWVTVILSAEGAKPAGMTAARLLEESRVKVVSGTEDTLIEGGAYRTLSGFPFAGEFFRRVRPGPAIVELRLPEFVDTRMAIVAMENRITTIVVVVQDDGAVVVQQYMFAPNGDNRLPPFPPPLLRELDLAQRFYSSAQPMPDTLRRDVLLNLKAFDPLTACMAGYEAVRRGLGTEYLGQPMEGAPDDLFEPSAMKNMLKFFGNIPDSHILAGLVQPDRRKEHFDNAVKTGVPLFVEGFNALQAFYRPKLPVPLRYLTHLTLPNGVWTNWIAREPMLRIENGAFEKAPPEWFALEASRTQIESYFASVGFVAGLDRNTQVYSLGGTAFVVGSRRIMMSITSIRELCEKTPDGWRLKKDCELFFSTAENMLVMPDQRISILGIESVIERSGVLILAEPVPPPEWPLPTLAIPLEVDEPLYLIGYPREDSRQDAATANRATNGKIGLKRLQPGILLSIQDNKSTFDHSCVTLGGNGGSPIFRLKTGELLGMHWGGLKKGYVRGRATLFRDSKGLQD